MRSSWHSALVALFALILLLPGLQMATHALPIPPLQENRATAARPPLAALADPADFTHRLETWFNDHYGLRDLLIRTKTQLDYSVFRTSDRIHIGRKGWLFYRSVIDDQEPAIEAFGEPVLDRTVASFARLRDWLAPRGIHLVVQTQMLKDHFYPEYLPREAGFATRRHRFDQFRAKLAALPGITYLDTTPMLEALKATRPIFHKTDFHWNDPAAFEAAHTLVDTIAALEHRPPLWHNQLRIVERPSSGGEALFMPLFHPPSETGLFVEPTWDQSGLIYDDKVPPFIWRFTQRTPSPTLLPGTVLFGDSFADGMVRSGLAIYFNELSYGRLYNKPFPDILRAMPPGTKYLVVEFIETALPSWIAPGLPD